MNVLTRVRRHLLLVAISMATLPATLGFAQSELAEEATWKLPDIAAVESQFAALAEEKQLDEATTGILQQLWSDSQQAENSFDLLQVGLKSATLIVPETATLVSTLESSQTPFVQLDLLPLTDERIPAWLRSQLSLATGIWYAQHQLYDESIELLSALTPEEVIDPVALLFYRGIAYQQVIQKEPALSDLTQLLEREEELPRRYRDVSKLVVADLQPLESDSLDEISRMMDDIRRRQTLHRSGTRVRKEEDDVIQKLDKLIEDLEQQQQQQQMAASASNSPASPAQDSTLKGGPAEGDVDQKAQGPGEDWGDLPAKERAAAMAELAKDLPAHYRELIEEYYRKLAEDPNSTDQ